MARRIRDLTNADLAARLEGVAAAPNDQIRDVAIAWLKEAARRLRWRDAYIAHDGRSLAFLATFPVTVDLAAEERSIIGMGTRDLGHDLDQLVARILDEWDDLTNGERCAGIVVIAEAIAANEPQIPPPLQSVE